MSTVRLDRILSMLQAQGGKDSFLEFALAKEYEGLNRPDEALQTYQSLLERDPDYVGLYYHYGKLLEKKGQSEQAAAIYEAGIQIAQKLQDFHARGELQQALDFMD